MWRKCNRDVGDGCNIYLHGCGCPCGYFSDAVRECNCSALAIARYQKRISGPLLDRIDIHIEVPRVDYEKLARKRQVETSATIRARVQAARERQIRGCVEREPDAFHVVFWKGVSERREVTVMGNRITRAAMHVSADEVQERIRREKQPWRRQRWEIISQALTAPRHAADIAGTVGVSLSTVYRVIALYQQAGVAAIETPGKGGRRRHYLTLWQERPSSSHAWPVRPEETLRRSPRSSRPMSRRSSRRERPARSLACWLAMAGSRWVLVPVLLRPHRADPLKPTGFPCGSAGSRSFPLDQHIVNGHPSATRVI
jgi:hypothetical protein